MEWPRFSGLLLAEGDAMADYEVVKSPQGDEAREIRPPGSGAAPGDVPVTSALLAYALFGVAAVAALISAGLVVFAPLVGVFGIIGVIVCYVKRDDAQNTWVASHFRWLIRTFWYSL